MVTTSIIVAITIIPMPVNNIMMILVTFPSGGLYLSGFSDAQRKSVRSPLDSFSKHAS